MPFHFTTARYQAVFCFLWLVPAAVLQAQTTPAKPQLFHIHEDPVRPTVVDEYERASKELVSQCRKHGIQDGWLTIQDNDHRYYTIEPIGHMADLDAELKPLIRRTESRIGHLRPDLSYSAAN